MTERRIEKEWVERVLRHPRTVTADPSDPDLSHAAAPVPEFGGRVLYNEQDQVVGVEILGVGKRVPAANLKTIRFDVA